MMYNEIANDLWMWLYVGILLFLCMAQCVIYMKRAWKHALVLGLHKDQLKKALNAGLLVSIFPAIPVLIVMLSLSPMMGVPIPWLRLSIIGSASYEANAANIGVQSQGEMMVLNGYSALAWSAAAWTMSVGGSACVLWSSLAIRPIDSLYNNLGGRDLNMIGVVGGSCVYGVMGYSFVGQGLASVSNAWAYFSAWALGAVLALIVKRDPKKFSKLSDLHLAICMLFGMAISIVVAQMGWVQD